jgi:hypothetical protein
MGISHDDSCSRTKKNVSRLHLILCSQLIFHLRQVGLTNNLVKELVGLEPLY